MSSVQRMMAKFNTAAPLPTPENFARSKREEKVKEARAIHLSRQRAAAYNMTLRALAIQATMRTKRNEEEDRKAREDARQKASNFRMTKSTAIKKGSPEEREIRAVHAMLSRLAVGDNADEDDQLSTIPESARNSNSAQTVRTVESNLHDDVVKEAEKQLNHQALVSFMQENYPDRMGEIGDLLKEFEGREDVLFEELTAKLNEELAAEKVKRAEEERQLLAERMHEGDLEAQADLDALDAAEKHENSKTAIEDLQEVAADAAAAIVASGGHLGRSGSFMSHASFSDAGTGRHESVASKASSSSKRSSTSRRSSTESKRSSTSRRSTTESKRTSVSSRKSSSRSSRETPSISEGEAVTNSDTKSRASSKASNKSFAKSHSGRKVATKQSSSFMSSSKHRGSVVGVLAQGVELRQVVHSFYSVYAPEKLDGVGAVIEHFRGRERDLFATLELKYDVTFSPDGSARPNLVRVPSIARGKSSSLSSSRSRLESKSSTTRKTSSSSHKSRSSKASSGSETGLSLPFVEASPVVTSKFAVDVQSRVLGDRMKAQGHDSDKVKAIVDSSGPMM